jgi:NADPH-dependent glutamate synthase beta subunit-like oxidoreductase
MKAFKHVNANTLEEAVELLKQSKGLAKPIAGGTDLLGILKDRILPSYPETIINLKTIPELDYIREEAEGLRIGALARLADIVESPVVRKRCKLLADAAQSIASPQIRNLATIGGNLGQEVRCWYYRYPHQIGGSILCARKRGDRPSTFSGDRSDGKEQGRGCSALMGENRYHSIFGAAKVGETPCTEDCPACTDIPAYLNKIREGDLKGAAAILLDSNPIPSITGRVCPEFCRERCNRGDCDSPVSIRNIERSMGDYILENAGDLMNPRDTASGKRVAVVGAGPAGLSAAFYLRRSGHRVEVFDRMNEPGGMLAYSIPGFRLPHEKVRSLVSVLEGMGIEFRLNTNVGKDVALEDLRKEFDSVFLATGAWALPSLGIEGESLTRHGLEFLSNAKQGINEVLGKRVLVIGGGNVAVDVAISALRQGAREVTMACLETRETMPALEQEVDKAAEEGVKLMPSWGPSRVLETDGKVKGMELVRCIAVYDQDGNFAPVFDDTRKGTIDADQIIMAVGQRPDFSYVGGSSKIEVGRGLVQVHETTQQTSVPDVFAGGDLTSGPATVVQAVAAGRRAASAISRFLSGSEGQEEERSRKAETLLTFHSDSLKHTSPISVSERPPAERNLVKEDTLSLKLSEAQIEANRCLNCGCVAVNASDMAPVLIVLGATIQTTQRTMSAEAFFSAGGAGSRLLAHDELLTEITIPCPANGTKCAYKKFRIRKSIDFPVVSLATAFEMDGDRVKDARIVLGALAPVPVRARASEAFLIGKVPEDGIAEQTAALAVANAIPLSGNAYKIRVVKALIKRSIIALTAEAVS